MFAFSLLTLASLWGHVRPQLSPTFSRGFNRDGRCIYSFTVPSPTDSGGCSESGAAASAIRELRTARSEQESRLQSLSARLAALESGQPGHIPPAAPGRADQLRRLEADKADLLRRLESLKHENTRLRINQCPSIRDTPQDSQQHTQGGAPRLSNLSSKQGSERGVTNWSFENPTYQELKSEITEIPASKLNQRSQPSSHSSAPGQQGTDCGALESVGEPVTFRKADTIAGRYGVWMKDPEPVPPHTHDSTWRINAVGTDVRQLFEYNDLDQFMKGYPSKVYVLPESVESTGGTIYRGSLYYQKRKSRVLLRYEMKTETIVVRKELSNAGYRGVFPYSWGGYTDIDFAVDEQGLWVIYSTNQAQGAIVISKLDPNTLEIQRTWTTTIRKKSVANSFMICGTLYTLSSYSMQNAFINFAYNTNTNSSMVLKLPFENRYRYNSMTDYYPAEKKIFAWDNFNMVMYDIRLSKI